METLQLIEPLEEVHADTATDAEITPAPLPNTDSQEVIGLTKHRWLSIAQDILLMQYNGRESYDVKGLCEYYKLDEWQLRILLQTPAFKEFVHKVREDVQARGANGAQILQATLMSNKLGESIFTSMLDPKNSIEMKDKIKFYEILTSQAGLDPKTNGTNRPHGDGGGGSIINIVVPQEVRGMDHVRNCTIINQGDSSGK